MWRASLISSGCWTSWSAARIRPSTAAPNRSTPSPSRPRSPRASWRDAASCPRRRRSRPRRTGSPQAEFLHVGRSELGSRRHGRPPFALARKPPGSDCPAARRRCAVSQSARRMRGDNPHGPHTTRRTGPRQELTVGSRKRKFLVDRASTPLGEGGNWELGRRGHAAAGGPQSPGTHASQPGQRCRADNPSSPGGRGIGDAKGRPGRFGFAGQVIPPPTRRTRSPR